jgi:hypothetical protein
MATAALKFDLSDEDDAREHKYAMAGKDALLALFDIESAIRSKLKYSECSAETRRVLEEIRGLIPHDLVDILA